MRLSLLIPLILLVACNTRHNNADLPPVSVTKNAPATIVITPNPNLGTTAVSMTLLATVTALPLPTVAIAPSPTVATVVIKPSLTPIATITALSPTVAIVPSPTVATGAIKPSLTPTRSAASVPTATPLPQNNVTSIGFKTITSTIKSPDGTDATQVCFDAVRNTLCQINFANGTHTPTFLNDTATWSNSHYLWMPVYETPLSPPSRLEVWDVKRGSRVTQLEFRSNRLRQPAVGWGPNSDVLAYVLDMNAPRLMLLNAATGAQTVAADCPDWILSQNLWSFDVWGQIDMTRLCHNYRLPTISSTVVTQRFEHGVMLWVQQNDSIYVLLNDQRLGVGWELLRNAWFVGMPEQDPNIASPAGKFQPVRGFGKEWRERFGQYGALRNVLGWAIEPEHATLNATVRCDFWQAATSCYLPAPNGGWYRLAGAQSVWEWVAN